MGAGAQPCSPLTSCRGVLWVGVCSCWSAQPSHSGRVELVPVPRKDGEYAVIGPQAQHLLTRMVNQTARLEYQLLHHGANSSALCAVAHGRIGLVQCVLTHQAQQVHGHRRQCTDQVVGVELARGQTREVHVGLELRMELLVRTMVSVQLDDGLLVKALGQGGAPALEHVLGQQQLLAPFVDGALGQAKHAARMQALPGMGDLDRLATHTLALALAQHRPARSRIGHARLGPRLYRRAARVPLDDEGHLTLQHLAVSANGAHQLGRIKARVGTKQQRGGATVVYGEGVHIQRHIAAGQYTEVNTAPLDLHAQHPGVDAVNQLEPRRGMRVQALAQGGRRRHSVHTQGAGKEAVLALAFDGIEVVLAQAQQAQVALENVAVGDAPKLALHRKDQIDQSVEVDALEVFANQRQAGMSAQVVGQLLKNEIDHRGLHLQGETQIEIKSLISNGNQHVFGRKITDSGEIKDTL